MGRGPRFLPSASGGPSISTLWPLPDSPRKLIPSFHSMRVFMLFLLEKVVGIILALLCQIKNSTEVGCDRMAGGSFNIGGCPA